MRGRSTFALITAAAAASAALAVWAAAFRSPALHRLDGNVFAALRDLQDGPIKPFASAVAGLVDPRPFALASVLVVGFALARGSTRLALLGAAILIGANLTTQGLKSVAPSPRVHPLLGDHQLIVESWPSGHATAAMSLVLAAILVAPPSLRAAGVIVGGVYASCLGASVLILGWHYPSDVVAGFLIAVAWAAAAVAAFPRALGTVSRGEARLARRGGLGLAAGGTVAIVAAPELPYRVMSSLDSPGVALGAAAVGVAALAVAAVRAARARREPESRLR